VGPKNALLNLSLTAISPLLHAKKKLFRYASHSCILTPPKNLGLPPNALWIISEKKLWACWGDASTPSIPLPPEQGQVLSTGLRASQGAMKPRCGVVPGVGVRVPQKSPVIIPEARINRPVFVCEIFGAGSHHPGGPFSHAGMG
jgi:hypothetical protein